MRGLLHKRHETTKSGPFASQWGKRYVMLNAKRGTLSCGKGEKDSNPRTILPMCDVTVVKEVEGSMVDWCDNCFAVVCPPLQLTLRAPTREVREEWIRVLRDYASDWAGNARLQEKALKSGVPAVIASGFVPAPVAVQATPAPAPARAPGPSPPRTPPPQS